MACREGNREEILQRLIRTVADAILEMQEGEVTTISQLVSEYYTPLGYEFRHIDLDHGYVWTKDGGKTYAVDNWDLMDVLAGVEEALKGQRELDFSQNGYSVVGLPFNLEFIVRKIC